MDWIPATIDVLSRIGPGLLFFLAGCYFLHLAAARKGEKNLKREVETRKKYHIWGGLLTGIGMGILLFLFIMTMIEKYR